MPVTNKSVFDEGFVPPPEPDEAYLPPAQPRSTGALVVRGSIWLLGQTLLSKAVNLTGQIALGWLLDPDDFGQIALAFTVTAFVALLINPGIDVILVRRGRRFDLWSTPAFYFSLATSMVGCLVILAAAPLAAAFYGSPKLFGILAISAIATPLGSLVLIPTAKLRAEMRFRALAAANFLQSVLLTVLVVAFAAIGFGVYSFVLPLPIVCIIMTVVLWAIAQPTVRLRRPLRHWKYLIGDSSYIFGGRAMQVLVGQGDYMTLGALYGEVAVGPYFFAFGIAQQAIRLTAGSLQLVLMAGLARIPSYSPQQTQAALRATKALALIAMPLCFLQAAVAGPLLHAFYGDKWVEAIPLVQLISLGMAFDVTSWTIVSLMQSRGQFKLLFYWAVGLATAFMITIVVGAVIGQAFGVAMALCLYYAVCAPLFAWIVLRSENVDRAEFLNIYLAPICVGALAAAASIGVIDAFRWLSWPPLVQCAGGLAAGLLITPIAARWLMPDTWHDILARLLQFRPSWLAPGARGQTLDDPSKT